MYLGLFCFGSHDAAVAAVDSEGRTVFAAEGERYSRIKQDPAFPRAALNQLMGEHRIQWSDVKGVAFAWDPWSLPYSALSGLLGRPERFFSFLSAPSPTGETGRVKRWRQMVGLPRLLRREFGFSGDFRFYSHHQCHGASALYSQGKRDGVCLVVDGNGENGSTALFLAQSGIIQRVWQRSYPHSLGHFFAACTSFAGLEPYKDEFKLMALAGYGNHSPVLASAMESLLRWIDEDEYALDLQYFSFQYNQRPLYSERFISLFGREAKGLREPWMGFWADFARAAQDRLEGALLRLCAKGRKLGNDEFLGLAGGVALNCRANYRIKKESGFKEVFVQPAAHDAGAALGAAQLLYKEFTKRDPLSVNNYYLGSFPSVNDRILKEFGEAGTVACYDQVKLNESLRSGGVWAWMEGAMEFGPRALGRRSFLASAQLVASRERLNGLVKNRENFQPFAAVVPLEKAEEFFELRGTESPYMTFAVPVRREKRELIPAVVHADGSCRVQTLREQDHPRLHKLLCSLPVPVLLNTSLNRKNEPILCSAHQLLELFRGTQIDGAVLEDFIVFRR